MAEAAALAVATPNLFQTVNPATGEKGPAYQGRTVDQALSIAADVHRAQSAWRRMGAWFPATILTNVLPGQAAHDEELFGPVAAVISAKDERDAIRIVNASEFGLGSAVITTDAARGQRIAAEELDAGVCFVNDNVRSDPRLPFGGVKNSG